MRQKRILFLSLIGLVGATWACAHRPTPTTQASAIARDEPIRAAWLAQRAADSTCAALPRVRATPGRPGWNDHRDPETALECSVGPRPVATAYVVDGKLHCPGAKELKSGMPPEAILQLRAQDIVSIDVRKDGAAFTTWSCSEVEGFIIVTTERANGRR